MRPKTELLSHIMVSHAIACEFRDFSTGNFSLNAVTLQMEAFVSFRPCLWFNLMQFHNLAGLADLRILTTSQVAVIHPPLWLNCVNKYLSSTNCSSIGKIILNDFCIVFPHL